MKAVLFLFWFWSFMCDPQDSGLDEQEVSIKGGGGLLMLYQLAEGERQRRPWPIQRPQCNSSRMPSIPMCCVKVEPTESYERGLSHEGHLKHTQTKFQQLCLMHPDIDQFESFSVGIAVMRNCDRNARISQNPFHLLCPLK